MTNTPSDNNNTNTPTDTGSIIIKVRRGPDLRRFEMSREHSSTLLSQVRSIWGDLEADARVTYLDDEGDSVTLASQADVQEAFLALERTARPTLRLTMGDPTEPQFASCSGKGKGGKGGKGKGKGKGGKGHRIAEALGITIDEARELRHKAHDGDEEARKTLQELRAAQVSKGLNITLTEAMALIEEARSGSPEARQKLKEMRHKMHPHFHEHPSRELGKGHQHRRPHLKGPRRGLGCAPHERELQCRGKGKGAGKGKFLAAVSGLPQQEVLALIDEARNGDQEARSKLQQIRRQAMPQNRMRPWLRRMGSALRMRSSALRAAFGRMRAESSSDSSGSSSSDTSSSDSD